MHTQRLKISITLKHNSEITLLKNLVIIFMAIFFHGLGQACLEFVLHVFEPILTVKRFLFSAIALLHGLYNKASFNCKKDFYFHSLCNTLEISVTFLLVLSCNFKYFYLIYIPIEAFLRKKKKSEK